MDPNKRLADNIRSLVGGQKITIYQGIVEKVNGITCTCRFGNVSVSGIRLRASLAADENQMLMTPATGAAVIVGSLSGDLNQLVVLQADRVESIVINGGNLGGLINIQALTDKINALVDLFNAHTHLVNTTGTATAQTGTAEATLQTAQRFDAAEYEDEKVKH